MASNTELSQISNAFLKNSITDSHRIQVHKALHNASQSFSFLHMVKIKRHIHITAKEGGWDVNEKQKLYSIVMHKADRKEKSTEILLLYEILYVMFLHTFIYRWEICWYKVSNYSSHSFLCLSLFLPLCTDQNECIYTQKLRTFDFPSFLSQKKNCLTHSNLNI